MENRPAGWLEILVAATLLGVMLVGQILICHPRVEYKQGYWLDEYDTAMVASDPDAARAAQTMLQDGTPPVYYWIIRPICRLAPGQPIFICRVCSTVAMWIVLIAIYGALRTAFAPSISAVALLLAWAHPLMARYTFEARSYAMMLAGIAGLLWSLRIRGIGGIICRLICAAWAYSMQYLGVLAVGLILLGELIAGPGRLRQRIQRILPACCGTLILLALLPWFFKQRQLFGLSWIDPFSTAAAGKLLITLFFPLTFLATFIFWWIGQWQSEQTTHYSREQFRQLTPMFALLFLPGAIIALAILGPSFLVDRYMIATVIGLPALAAPLIAQMNRPLRFGLGVLLLVLSIALMQWNAGRLATNDRFYASTAEQARQDLYPIYFVSRFDAYPMWFRFPDLQPRIATIDLRFESNSLPRSIAFDQRAQAMREESYHLPPMISLQTARDRGIFRYIGPAEGFNAMTGLHVVDSQHNLCEFGAN